MGKRVSRVMTDWVDRNWAAKGCQWFFLAVCWTSLSPMSSAGCCDLHVNLHGQPHDLGLVDLLLDFFFHVEATKSQSSKHLTSEFIVGCFGTNVCPLLGSLMSSSRAFHMSTYYLQR